MSIQLPTRLSRPLSSFLSRPLSSQRRALLAYPKELSISGTLVPDLNATLSYGTASDGWPVWSLWTESPLGIGSIHIGTWNAGVVGGPMVWCVASIETEGVITVHWTQTVPASVAASSPMYLPTNSEAWTAVAGETGTPVVRISMQADHYLQPEEDGDLGYAKSSYDWYQKPETT